MEIFYSAEFIKYIDRFKSKNDSLAANLIKIQEKIIKANSVNDLYEINSLGFKKYKGTKKNVYGIDFGLPGSSNTAGERIIATFVEEFEKEYFKDYLNDNIGLIFHTVSKHDAQSKKASNISNPPKEYYYQEDDNYYVIDKNDHKKIEESINLNSKYEKLRSNNIETPRQIVLTSDKTTIIEDFLSNPQPTIISGIAGSGKTVLITELMERLILSNPNSKVLFVTMSEKLCLDVGKRLQFVNNSNLEFRTLKNLLRRDNTDLEFESLEIFERFIQDYKNDTKGNHMFRNEVIKFLEKNEIYNIYSEIYGLITGSMLLNWDRKTTDQITLNDYKNLPRDYKVININDLELVYELTKIYIDYLKNKKLSLLNSECMEKNLTNIKSEYDYIIVDEIQDLTEVQIYYLYNLVENKNNVVFAGDPNQVINPTFFDIGRIGSLFTINNPKFNIVTRLNKNFRNSVYLTQLINFVDQIRNQYLPARKEEYSQIEESHNISDGNIYNFVGKEEVLYEALDYSNVYILVSEKSKANQDDDREVLSITEFKGMEEDTIILKNIISDYIEQFDSIFSNSKKDNALLEYYFNLFYVGITRTKYNLIIYEEKKSVFFDKLLKETNNIIEEINVITKELFNFDKSASGFINRAKKLIDNKKYDNALKALEKAKFAYDYDTLKIEQKQDIDKYFNICNIYLNNTTDRELAKIFEDKRYYDYALIHFTSLNNYFKVAIINLYLNGYEKGAREFELNCSKYDINIFDIYKLNNEDYNKVLDDYIENKNLLIDIKMENIDSNIKKFHEIIERI